MPKESCAQKGICLSRVFTFLFKSLWDFLICNFLMVSSMWGPFHAAATFSLAWERLNLNFHAQSAWIGHHPNHADAFLLYCLLQIVLGGFLFNGWLAL